MLNNHFTNAPTVGSHDKTTTIDELQSQITALEQSLKEAQEKMASMLAAKEEKPPLKIKWKKLRKFFTTFVRPILTFIPNFINAISHWKKVNA